MADTADLSVDFFVRSPGESLAASMRRETAAGGMIAVLKPGLLYLKPRGAPWRPFVLLWLWRWIMTAGSRRYSLYTVRYGRDLVHFSCVLPSSFRFPFMQPGDVLIGPVWTHPSYRGRGYAGAALRRIVADHQGQRQWYLVRRANRASQALIETAGFHKGGSGVRTRRLGLVLLGSFELAVDSQAKQAPVGTDGQ
jgi:RimJ/RimL family protein N-acetyltransferase